MSSLLEISGTWPHVSLEGLIGGGGLIVIAPSPSAEVLGCGGLLARALAAGRPVKVVILGDGSHPGPLPTAHAPEDLVRTRKRQTQAALASLGLKKNNLHFMDLKDGSLPSSGPQAFAMATSLYKLARSSGVTCIVAPWRARLREDEKACYAIARQVHQWNGEIKLIEYPIGETGHSTNEASGDLATGFRLDIAQHLGAKSAAMARSKANAPVQDHETYIVAPHDHSPFQTISKIHQIWLSDDFNPRRLPQFVLDNAASLQSLYPAAQYELWDATSLRALIAEHFAPSVLDAFDSLQPYAYKSDLGRYCILYVHGGLYADLSMKFLTHWNIPNDAGFASFRDYEFGSPSWTAIAIGLLWAMPRRREFEIAIDYIVENCRTKFYGRSSLFPTGPVLLGRALAAAMAEKAQRSDADDQWIGLSRALTPDASRKNIAFISPDKAAVALLAKETGGDLTHLGAVGTNNYNTIWQRRSVYGEKHSSWSFDDLAICLTDLGERTETGIISRLGAAGILTYGPYIALDAGRYRLGIVAELSGKHPRMLVEVTYDEGAHLLLAHEHPKDSAVGSPHVTIDFELATPLLAVEFTTRISGDCRVKIRQIVLERLD